MNFEFFIGIDVSKSELDFAVMHGKDPALSSGNC
jgi:hypothetical protein